MEDSVECLTVYGHKKPVPRSKLQFRPGAYALAFREGKILLVVMRLNGKLTLPGGGIELGEQALDALRREVLEETGLDVSVGKFVDAYESFAYFDPSDEAFHCILLCWDCQVLPRADGSFDPIAGDPEEGVPLWADVASIREEDCHGPAWNVICRYLMKFHPDLYRIEVVRNPK